MLVCVSVSPICATNQELNLVCLLVLCLHMKITTCLLVLINQLRKLDNSFSCELVSSLSAYESCLIYLEQSCHSILSSSMGILYHLWYTKKIKFLNFLHRNICENPNFIFFVYHKCGIVYHI